MPIGVPGELYLGGAGLARGYFGKPEQTAERFGPNPFDDQLNVRLYRTGDRVRFRNDGTLEHLGRLDEQVKIRGFRIELGEITSVLAEFSSVEEAITIVRQAPDGNPQLVAYYVATDTVDRVSLVAWLAERLPHYMVPSAFVQLHALPKTLNGKIEKKRLPAPNAMSALKVPTNTVVQDPVELAVFEAWANVLGYPPESDKTFFTAGGNSLQAVQLIARVQNQLGITISLAKFVEQPTAQGLINLARNISVVPNDVRSPSESYKRGEEGASLTFAERRLWVQQQLEPNDTSYLLSVHLRLEGNVEIARLVDALRSLLTRHNALRRCIVLEGGLPRSVILPIESVPIAVEPPVEPSAVESSLVALARRDGSCSFDLAYEAPTRIRILPVGSGVVELLITIHHVSFDDWSLELLAEDLVATYEGRLSPPPTLSLADIAAMEQALFAMPEKRAAVHRWVKQVGDMPLDLQLGDVGPRPTNRSDAGAVYEAELSVDARRAVTAIARRVETTEFAVLMAAFQSLLWSETGSERFLVGIALAGRHQVEVERIVGCFVNMLPLPAEVQPHVPFELFVTDVSRRLFDLIAHQDIPVERWLEALREHRWVDGRSLVRVGCGAHNARHRQRLDGERLTVSARFLPPTTARLDLTLWIEEREEKLYALWTYATDLFTREDVVRRHLRFDAVLSQVNQTKGALIKDVVAVSSAKPPEKSNIGIRTMTFGNNQRSFDRWISLKAKRSSDFVRVEKNWLNGNLPLLIEAQISGLPLADWITSRRDVLREDIVRHGGILFRGFSMQEPADFAAAARAFASDLLDYKEQSSPRTQISEQVYTSTDHPADQPIFLHNEQSYTVDWPLFILFFCLSEPSHGGRTPIADNRRILTRLPDEVLDRFTDRGILYVRNYIPGISLSWQDVFQTDNKHKVEVFCERNQIRFCWMKDDHLRTWQRRSAFQIHPVTGDRLWFNHALFFHATSLLPKVRDALLKVLPEEDLPYNTYYGDSSPIEHDTLEAIRAAIAQETIRFDWHRGDLLILDNMLTQHGREPYEGSRRILTAMATLYSSLACPIIPETPNYCIARTIR